MGVCSPRPLDTASSASTLPDSPAGCVGLAANGAGPRRCTAGVTPASTRTQDRRTEARQTAPVLCTPAMESDHTQSRELATTLPLPPGCDQPQSSHVLHGTSGGLILWCLRVTPKSTSAHPWCRKQDLLSALGGGLPEVLRPTRRPSRQRSQAFLSSVGTLCSTEASKFQADEEDKKTGRKLLRTTQHEEVCTVMLQSVCTMKPAYY